MDRTFWINSEFRGKVPAEEIRKGNLQAFQPAKWKEKRRFYDYVDWEEDTAMDFLNDEVASILSSPTQQQDFYLMHGRRVYTCVADLDLTDICEADLADPSSDSARVLASALRSKVEAKEHTVLRTSYPTSGYRIGYIDRNGDELRNIYFGDDWEAMLLFAEVFKANRKLKEILFFVGNSIFYREDFENGKQ